MLRSIAFVVVASVAMMLVGCGPPVNKDPKITDANVPEIKPIPLPASPGPGGAPAPEAPVAVAPAPGATPPSSPMPKSD